MANSDGQDPRLWEIWHARFDYSEGKGYKFRPVIVVGLSDCGMLAMVVTSSANKLSLPHGYLIKDWEFAGLAKPSIARADRVAELPPNYLGSTGRIGRLSERDANAISLILEAMGRE